MIQDFIKLFDQKFIVGYVTPVIIFIAFVFSSIPIQVTAINSSAKENLVLNMANNSTISILNSGLIGSLWSISIIIFLIYIISLVLSVFNLIFIKFLEGYYLGEYLAKKIPVPSAQLDKFDKLKARIDIMSERYIKELQKSGNATNDTIKKYAELMQDLKAKFPSDREDVLITSLGNTIRAFENYSYEMYGMDAVAIWTRFYNILSKDQKESLNDAKSYLDFSINIIYLMAFYILIDAIYEGVTKSQLFFIVPLIIAILFLLNLWMFCPIIKVLSYITISIYVIFMIHIGYFWNLLVIISAIIIIKIAFLLSIRYAEIWGINVKAVIDLYRINLLSQMGFKTPETLEEERNYWQKISRSFAYWEELDLQRKIESDNKNK